jgi:hypothetical protein
LSATAFFFELPHHAVDDVTIEISHRLIPVPTLHAGVAPRGS